MNASKQMDQGEFTSIFCVRPQNFAWFLGAGASATAGLPTATDIIWDLKRRYYCREENQDISRQDMQNEAIRTRIQGYMESRGFPVLWAPDEYPAYFEKIFAQDKERLRRYLKAILSEDRVTLSVGNRVLAALIASGLCRAAFTTNFDSVVEKAVAEVAGQSLSAYHLEGSTAANQALNNEEYPIYCKLHGDFRYDSLKNLPADLATQNAALSECLVNAGNRFGFIVTGYSGRDLSIMDLIRTVLETNNPFPHGLFWTGIKGSAIRPAVEDLLEQARAKGVNAEYVPIETFDALMLRLWRNIDGRPAKLDAQVRKLASTSVSIPLPQEGSAKPVLRLNALPVLSLPSQYLELTFKSSKDWDDIRRAGVASRGNLILTKAECVWCWGARDLIKQVFGADLSSIGERDTPTDLCSPHNLYVKGFVEEALCKALARKKPLRTRMGRSSAFLISDSNPKAQSDLEPLSKVIGATSGIVAGLVAPVTDDHPHPEKVTWAEAVRVSIDFKNGQLWLLLDPDISIWPPRARKIAVDFLDQRRGDRYNKTYNALLDAWVRIILGTDERNAEITFSAFDGGTGAENPSFRVASRTAFARRLVG
jgi:SIR2-like domain